MINNIQNIIKKGRHWNISTCCTNANLSSYENLTIDIFLTAFPDKGA